MVRLYWSEATRSNCKRDFSADPSLGLQLPFPKTASCPMEKTHSRFLFPSAGWSSSTFSERSKYQDTEKRESREDWEGMLQPSLTESDSSTVTFDSDSSTCSRTSARCKEINSHKISEARRCQLIYSRRREGLRNNKHPCLASRVRHFIELHWLQ